jgi:uncharacterized cupin superfamily protein
MERTHFDDVPWPEAERIATDRVLSGSPEASTLVLHKDDRCETGVWRVTPGEFTTVHEGYVEAVTITAGRGRLIDDEGTVTELTPGTVAVLENGWRGRWAVDETIVKSYAVITAGS